MAEAGVTARRAALTLLDAALGESRALSELTGENGPLARLDGPERARAQRLAIETFRHLGRADRMLKPHMRRAPHLTVHNALRLAVVEIYESGAAAHGVVNSAVAMVRGNKRTAHAAGMVNAILRKVSDAEGSWARLPVQELPGWLRGRFLSAYGSKTVAAIERAHAKGAPLDLTPKDGNTKALAERLGGEALPTGSVRLPSDRQVTSLAGYTEGDWWVQDTAASLPARILDVKPGEHVADLCAAPGGKTLQLAAAGADVTAVDISQARLFRLRENLKRTGLSAKTVAADVLDWNPENRFDAILLDAPCSATGTIRRHPELPFIRKGSDLKALFVLQATLIDRAIGFLKPHGRLLYATCSLLPDEGEAQIEAVLQRNPEIRVDSASILVPGVAPEWRSKEGGLRLRPDYWDERNGIDGFYIALLRRQT